MLNGQKLRFELLLDAVFRAFTFLDVVLDLPELGFDVFLQQGRERGGIHWPGCELKVLGGGD